MVGGSKNSLSSSLPLTVNFTRSGTEMRMLGPAVRSDAIFIYVSAEEKVVFSVIYNYENLI